MHLATQAVIEEEDFTVYTPNPTPASLVSALVPKFSDIQIVEAGEYVQLTSSGFQVIAWVHPPYDVLYIRAVVAKNKEIRQLSESQRHELAAELNSGYCFGRFNAECVVGLVYDYEILYVPSISLDLVAQSIDLVASYAKSAREIFEHRREEVLADAALGEDS